MDLRRQFSGKLVEVIELSIKEKWSYLAKEVEFRWFSATDPVTIFDSNCRKCVLFDKQISKFAFSGTILNHLASSQRKMTKFSS